MSLKKSSLTGTGAGLLAALGWGTIGIWVQNIPLEASELAVLRFLFSGIFLSLISIPLFRGIKLEPKIILKSFVCGAILLLQFFASLYAYQNLFLGEAALLTNLHLVFLLMLLLPVLLKRKQLGVTLLGTFFLALGLYLTLNPALIWNVWGISAALFSSFLFALYTYLLEKFFPTGSEKYIAFIFGSGAVLSLPWLFVNGLHLSTLDSGAWLNLAILLIFSTLLAHLSYMLSVKLAGSLKAAVLSYFAILFGFALDALFFRTVSLSELLGAMLVFVTLCVFSLKLFPINKYSESSSTNQ